MRIVSPKERGLIHYCECFHFRTDLFDSKCQSELLTLIVMKFTKLPEKFTQQIYSAPLQVRFFGRCVKGSRCTCDRSPLFIAIVC